METFIGKSSELHSSVHQVISDDDLLTEILVRLPVASLLRFKSVSKHWLSLIKSPYFITLHRNQNPNIEPPSGLFLKIHNAPFHDLSMWDAYDFLRLHKTNSSPIHTTFLFGSDGDPTVKILQSCNGLFLCCIRPNLFIYNPSTNEFKFLPYEHYSELAQLKLAFDPIKSPHYKIVHAGILCDVNVQGRHSIQIQTYSSETCDWSVYPHLFPTHCFACFNDGIYWNGVIHWLVYGSSHYSLDVNHLVLMTIQNPPAVGGKMYFDHKLFESRGCLLHACVVYTQSTLSRELNVYEMRNSCSEWSVRYIVDIDYVMTLIPETWEMHDDIVNDKLQRCLRCVVMGEREEDSFLVVELYGKVVKYNIELQTLSTIYDFTGSSVSRYFPLIPSLSGV